MAIDRMQQTLPDFGRAAVGTKLLTSHHLITFTLMQLITGTTRRASLMREAVGDKRWDRLHRPSHPRHSNSAPSDSDTTARRNWIAADRLFLFRMKRL